MYVAGALLVLFVAVGVGVTAAVVVGWQFGRVATDSAETSTLEGGKSEMTSSVRALEDTAIEPFSDSKHSDDTTYKASFIHRATDENSRGDYAYIADPAINGSPDAIVLISDQKNIGSTSYNHNIGVWYEGGAERWAIFNLPGGGSASIREVRPLRRSCEHRWKLHLPR